MLEGSPTGLEMIEDPGFKEVPHAMLDPKDGETFCARSSRAEHILLPGPCGFARTRERIVFAEPNRNMRQLMLCDNLGLTVAIERRRSRSYKILMVVRHAVMCLARNIRLSIWRIALETNPFDEPSRFFFNLPCVRRPCSCHLESCVSSE